MVERVSPIPYAAPGETSASVYTPQPFQPTAAYTAQSTRAPLQISWRVAAILITATAVLMCFFIILRMSQVTQASKALSDTMASIERVEKANVLLRDELRNTRDYKRISDYAVKELDFIYPTDSNTLYVTAPSTR